MKIKYKNKFQEHGCTFTGNLAVVDYNQDFLDDPKSQQWGGGSVFDWLDKAKDLLKKNHPTFDVLLAMPVLVARLPEGDQVNVDSDWGVGCKPIL